MKSIKVRNYRVITLSLLLGLSVLGLSLMLARPQVVRGVPTTRTVNTLSDTHSSSNGNDGHPALTLREAIQASAAGDTINFSVAGTITLTTGELAIARNLTIIGPTSGGVIVSGNNSRIFNITGGTVNISNIVISNGRAGGTNGTNCTTTSCSGGGPGGPGQGGGILNNANSTLFLTNCALIGNAASGGSGGTDNRNIASGGSGGGGSGGGIYNLGTLKLENCTLSGNSANGGNGGGGFSGGGNGGPAFGGSLYNQYPQGILTMENCTLNDNHANGGNGATCAFGDQGNGGSGGNVEGGSIYNESTLTLIACTLSGNSANGGRGGSGSGSASSGFKDGAGGSALGGGVFDSGSGNYRNSIIAGDTLNGGIGSSGTNHPQNGANGATIGPDVDGPISSQGFNLIGRTDGSLGWVSTDLLGGTTDATKLNPQLGSLQFNGGQTYTMALLSGSAAINAGDDSITGPPLNLTTDQRGLERKVGSHVDIGAFEVQLLNISTVSPKAGRTSGGQQITLTGAFVGLLTVTMGGSSASWSYTNGGGDTSTITVTTPVHAFGAVQIDLSPVSGTGYSKPNAFAYLPTVFTDDTIVVGQTTAKGQHIIELRQTVDAMRAVAGLGGAPWTDPSLVAGNTIRANHILDLRTYLNDAANRLGYSTSTYADPGLTTGFVIKRIHIEELRQRIRTIAG